MYALLYRSAAACSITEADIDGIREAARERNGLWGVTGVLLCGTRGDGFVQWLEGERETVLDLYAHIQADPRHTALGVIASGDALLDVTAGQRLFDDWEMRIHDVEMLPLTVDGFLGVALAAPADAVSS